MKKFKLKHHTGHLGFTLVELLIVVIIIGIIAGFTMLQINGMKAKTTATRIIADLRTMKSGLVMYYADTGAWPAAGDWDAIKNYIDTSSLADEMPSGKDQPKIYAIRVFGSGVNQNKLFVMANVNDNNIFGIDELVREKLAERQAEYNLLNNSPPGVYKKTNTIILIEVNK